MISWRNNLFGCFLLAAFCLPLISWADGFVVLDGGGLVSLPGMQNIKTTGDYIQALYNLSIWVAAFLAVIKIIFAGVQYMFTELIESKSNAKKDIQGAILGLVIVLAAVLVLETINPNLTNFTLFKDVPTPSGSTYEPPAPKQTQPERLESECAASNSCTVMACEPAGGPTMCQVTKEKCQLAAGRGEIDTPSTASARLFCFK